jgi:hypothetical protein
VGMQYLVLVMGMVMGMGMVELMVQAVAVVQLLLGDEGEEKGSRGNNGTV